MEQNEVLLGRFQKNYDKVLEELDILHRGVYDADEGMQTAALCLLTQAPLIKLQASAELRARSLKRDIEFTKAKVYAQHRNNPPNGKKITDTALKLLVEEDSEVHRLYQEQNLAEKEAKELTNILLLLRDAHISFRSIAKKGE